MARVLRVDAEGVALRALGSDRVVDVLFDDRRIWSFWVRRDTTRSRGGQRSIGWPRAMRPHLRGTGSVTLREHVSGTDLWSGEVRFSDDERRVEFVDRQGNLISLDKSDRFSPVFAERSASDLDPLLRAMTDLLEVLAGAGVHAFPAYGTLLGAVREGDFLGHDSDADLGYVSSLSHPVDVVRESFRLQRVVGERGYSTYRYSGLAFRVEVVEADGATRFLDVFGGFLDGGRLYLMGEVGTPYERDWLLPLGTTSLRGHTFPAPARPEKLLEAMYGPSWRVPDPAFKFETPAETVEVLNQWFRGTGHNRRDWERRAAQRRRRAVPKGGSSLAKELRRREAPGTLVMDVGAGRGRDALWLARQGFSTIAYDFAPRGLEKARRTASRRGLELDVVPLNLDEWRWVLSEGARVSRLPEGPRAMLARNVLDATDEFGRQSLGRLASMTLRGGGTLYVQTWTGRGRGAAGLVPVKVGRVQKLVEKHGGTVLDASESPGGGSDGGKGSVGKVVARWD